MWTLKMDHIQELISMNVDFLGFILWKITKICPESSKLRRISNQSSKGKVGVFCEWIDWKKKNCREFQKKPKLNFIQLHGDEDENFIKDLRKMLKKKCKIIKVFRVGTKLSISNFKI